MEPKLVYLFELDSVRKTDQEILEGQKTLYNELVYHGNCDHHVCGGQGQKDRAHHPVYLAKGL